MMLSAQQLSQFDTAGYLVLPDLLPPPVLAAVRAEYAVLLDKLYADWHGRGLVPDPAGLDFWGKLGAAYDVGVDYVFDMITAPHLLRVVEQLIGPEITSNPIQHLRIKPPARQLKRDEIRPHITVTDWHQDRAVALADADQTDMITVWLAITDATVENGCLQVQPKAPDQTMIPHCPRTQTGIPEGLIDAATAIPLPIPAGGGVIFHPLTPHASLPNRTDGFRWSFDIRFNRTGQPTGRSHFPEFVARSRKNPDSVLTDWRDWRQMWEDTRARLAHAPHTDIHRWTSDAPHCA